MTFDFGDMRELLHHPSQENWFKLVNLLELVQDHQKLKQELLPYLHHHLQSWPDAIRPTPDPWLSRIAQSTPDPRYSLARTADIDLEHHPISARELLSSTLASHLSQLSLSQISFTHQELSSLLRTCQALEELRMTHCGFLTEVHQPPLDCPSSATLRKLSITHDESNQGALHRALLQKAEALHELRLDDVLTPGSFTIPHQGLHSLRSFELLHTDARPFLKALELAIPTHLRHLTIQNAELIDEPLLNLLQHPKLGPIETLRLADNHLSEIILDLIAISPQFASLRILDLDSNSITPASINHLFQATHLTQLELLDLSFAHAGLEAFQHLPHAPFLQTLRMLSLHANYLPTDAADLLVQAHSFPQLRELYLGSNELGDTGAAKLAQLDLPRLEELYLFGNNLSWRGITPLLQSPWMQNVQVLHIADQALGDPTVDALIDAPHLSQLQLVSLRDAELSSKAIERLLHTEHLLHVQWELSGNEPNDDELRQLALAAPASLMGQQAIQAAENA